MNDMHVGLKVLVKTLQSVWVSTVLLFTLEAQHGATVPDSPSKKCSVKDTLFLSRVGSERTEDKWGDVAALEAELFPQPTEAAPGRDRVSVGRVGELGQRKIPGLCLTGWVPSVQQRYRRGARRGNKKETLRTQLRRMRSTITKERKESDGKTWIVVHIKLHWIFIFIHFILIPP